MAFLPIPITILVLVLKAAQDKGIAQPSSVIVEEDPEEREGESSREERTEKGAAPSRVKGEPATGFGPAPVSEREILVTSSIIVVPSLLMTWEQGIRTAQVFYRPVPGQPQPWVSPSYLSLYGLDHRLTVPSSTCPRQPFGSQSLRSSGLLSFFLDLQFFLADLATCNSFNRHYPCCPS